MKFLLIKLNFNLSNWQSSANFGDIPKVVLWTHLISCLQALTVLITVSSFGVSVQLFTVFRRQLNVIEAGDRRKLTDNAAHDN